MVLQKAQPANDAKGDEHDDVPQHDAGWNRQPFRTAGASHTRILNLAAVPGENPPYSTRKKRARAICVGFS